MRLSESVTVHAPVHEVFERLRDLAGAPEHVPGITGIEVLRGPARMEVGTRWRETRRLWGQDASEEMEVVSLREDDHYEVVAHHGGMVYLSGFQVAPVATARGEATRVTQDFEAHAITPGARAASLLMRPMSGIIARQCREDLLAIKASFED
ncbi:Carbon monoxide dehydrogenase subunit G [Kytococcus aerolatus]|uniref:Carbon monoxide dehydrogenase subunit G n=1 Tax=Kytococcus aerolatus TaxID=592308 RepID=A0A212TIH2_9MICO|nr:SRPBCC family protein [Kytococcus aerolatus]SNC65621.1 Carbon monoxide dehydrogenase subunit G [Kytococcus aerolatus]